ncbi:KPN_02809 family neutral zinc metallopeptidase [Qipengyuania atrilutea]|uniref:Neutral zinc metallopeptidase n=1 Tax=Qipengyuania atrilutea TaxID=2744473 RepID=A0A850H129_9SPHN|nr:neutral zinc metallopeptidase [Actirhodobacter atriluteus]NVD43952.1 neutral zinc metallopeptidase [Actirhodobacter atriluteus]
MRLNPFDTGNISVRGGGGGGFPGGGGGKIGCGTLVIAAIGALVFGINPMQTIGVVEGVQQKSGGSATISDASEQEVCTESEYATEACNALQSLNQTWEPVFQQAGIEFSDPTLTLYSRGINSGCGSASSAMGPFYCPADQGIYLDTSFYDTMERQMGAGGDFARYYVIAHEYGHHIQTITGISDQIRSAQSQNPRAANQLQVLMELQADCYAGVWAGKNRNLIEPGDIEEGMQAASAIGDDTLMEQQGQRVNPENFTHGTSEQRMQALRLGLQGDDASCDEITRLR